MSRGHGMVQRQVLEIIEAGGKHWTDNLAARVGASDASVRRALRRLEDEGRVVRVPIPQLHGQPNYWLAR